MNRLLISQSSPPASPPSGCAFCGQPDAHLYAGQFICDDCYTAKGSCCAGDE